jgi:fluoride exporter
MKTLLIIGTGSFIGGVCRYLLYLVVQSRYLSAFPFGTLVVNLLGCFLIGIVYGLSEQGNLASEWRVFLATGLLGGFTTFSAFSNETVWLLREGQLGYAAAYIVSSVVIGLVATFLGISIVKLF